MCVPFAPWLEVFCIFTLSSRSDASSQSIEGVSMHSATAQHHCQRPKCRHLFLIGWEAEGSKIKFLNLFLHEGCLIDLQATSLLTWWWGKLWPLFRRALILMGSLPCSYIVVFSPFLILYSFGGLPPSSQINTPRLIFTCECPA